MKKAIVVVVGVMGFAGSATAQAPVAVVEEVQGNVTGAEFMDYVVPGKSSSSDRVPRSWSAT